MNAQNSITHDEFSNFLRAGAIWRRQGVWYLFFHLQKSTEEILNTHVITIGYRDFFDEQQSVYLPSKVCQMSGTELEKVLNNILKNDTLLKINNWQDADFASFSESFAKIQESILQGVLKKAVPVVFEKNVWVPTITELAKMIFHLIRAPDHLNVYGIWDSRQGVLGATPEILVEIENQTLSTMALAGTLPKKPKQNVLVSFNEAEKKLLNDEKELSEHEFVVNDLMSELKHFGQSLKNGPYVVELPSLYHLRTDLEFKISQEVDFQKITKSLHPTPALGTFPRHLWREWLKELPEQKNRKSFGAPFFLQTPTWKTAIVGIRSIDWSAEGTRIGSGCGVVADSDIQKEWYELKQKRESVKKLLGMIE